MKKFAALACVLLCGGGCSAVSVGPERVLTVNDQVHALQVLHTNKNVDPKTFNPQNFDLTSYVTERMFEIDLEYNTYFANLTTQAQLGNAAGDVIIAGLGLAGTIVPASSTKTILAATSTVVAGAKTTVDTDVLLSHTIQILQSQMEASRTIVRNRILGSLYPAKGAPVPTIPYTVWIALSDLEDYYRAGTIPGALEALAAATNSNAQNAKNCSNGVNQASQMVDCGQSNGNQTKGKGSTKKSGVTSRGVRVPALQY